MIIIKKNWIWFLIQKKDIKIAIESEWENLDFETSSKEKRGKWKKMIFDWPWEYETIWIWIHWVEINDQALVSFNVNIWKTSITHIPQNINETRDKFLDEMEDSDILLVSVWNESDTKFLKNLIGKIEPRITIFWWENADAMKELFSGCEVVEDVSVSSLPVDKTEYYVLKD